MGRRPEPAGVKAAKAAVRSTRKASPEVAAGEAPEAGLRAPAWLKGKGLEIWQKRGPILRDMRLLTAVDEPAFARYCRNFGKWLDMREALDKRGYTYDATTTQGGKLRRADPAFLIADRLERQLLAVEDRFGMNPSERQRIFAARAVPGRGELPFDSDRRPEGAATAAQPIDSPIGALN
ncbi:phage terminase small subunit P27 family [Phenylobacterium sp.]|uniref:phage terminase small subunit P27 family n=1 Tax=Phenylobacterium sp. TaxID=1871053 RepID=UPI00301BB454